MLTYIENALTSTKAIADLRRSVGWNGIEELLNNPLMTSYYHIACYDGDRLVGYVDTTSNGVTDAYIQDLTVDPAYHEQGIGTELMNRIIARLRENKIYMISVIFEEKLLPFYERFGFYPMLAGQLQTYESD